MRDLGPEVPSGLAERIAQSLPLPRCARSGPRACRACARRSVVLVGWFVVQRSRSAAALAWWVVAKRSPACAWRWAPLALPLQPAQPAKKKPLWRRALKWVRR